jgi:hypothetical protein
MYIGMTEEQSAKEWTRRLEETTSSCARLIADGGADYDHEHVNPAVFMDVLTGDKTGGRVVPSGEGSAVIIGLYSHGWSHEAYEGAERDQMEARLSCDICGKTHDAADRSQTPPECVTCVVH